MSNPVRFIAISAVAIALAGCSRPQDEVVSKIRAYCPHPSNPPERVSGLPRITSITGFQAALAALDEHGQMWIAHRGDTCGAAQVWKVLPPTVTSPNLVNPQLDRFTSIVSGPHFGGYATTPHGDIVRWSPYGSRRISFNGVTGITPSCDESVHNCLPRSYKRLTDVVMVGSGDSHSLLLRSNGEVWSVGDNDCGQLGRADEYSPPDYMPIGRVESLHHVTAISAGYKSSLALNRDGRVLEWGNIKSGYLWSESGKPSGDARYCRKDPPATDFADAVDDSPNSQPRQVPGLSKVTAISAFYAFNLALKEDGTVWGWGQNGCGQLGIAPDYSGTPYPFFEAPVQIGGLPPIEAIAAGKRHALALDRNGGVWAWGYNNETELGSNPQGPSASQACEADGRAPGHALFSARPLKVPGIPRVRAITAAYNFGAALDENGDVWVWGEH